MKKRYFKSNIPGYAGHIVVSGISSRPKGLGRRNPHCGIFTRNGHHEHGKECELLKRKLKLAIGPLGGQV